eukprot:scaffold20.g7871.t1
MKAVEKVVSFLPDAAAAAAAASGAAAGKAKPPLPKPGLTRKGKWLVVDSAGHAVSMEVSKLKMSHELGLALRDWRLLDPSLATSYPSAILAREKALVVNLEFIKCIITRARVYVTNLDDQNTLQFVEELQRRLPASPDATMPLSPSLATLTGTARQAAPAGTARGMGGRAGSGLGPPGGSEAGGSAQVVPLSSIRAPVEELPFELRALEVALDMVSLYLEGLATDLEAASHPALDALTARISTGNLERVRRIKNRMVRLTTRVETLREVLEKLLDDDEDMKDLHLTGKEQDAAEVLQRRSLRAGTVTPFDVPVPFTGATGNEEAPSPRTPRTDMSLAHSSSSSSSSSKSSLGDDPDVGTVEMLLEPYFMMVDNTHEKLQALGEYIQDTEDYINIELDSHRNDLFRLILMLTSFEVSVNMITAITGLFAMNLMLQPGVEGQGPYWQFVTISVVCGTATIVLFGGILTYCRLKGLI